MLLQIWDTKEAQVDTNVKTSGSQLAPPARATTSSVMSVQRVKHVHFKAQFLILLEQLPVEIILSTDLFLRVSLSRV